MSEKGRADIGLLVLRIGAGGLLAVLHGWPKLQRLMDGGGFADPIGLGPQASLILVTFAELACATLVAVGLLTRLACIPVIITMLVAVLVVHSADPLAKKELALMFLTSFVAIFLTGPGRWSIDRRGS